MFTVGHGDCYLRDHFVMRTEEYAMWFNTILCTKDENYKHVYGSVLYHFSFVVAIYFINY